ncbi:hypothetical protein DPMN_135306 [Dreissena polymorpha]|uniref:Uncharacterized protein n=1 Tax=Dreissena polymorpha TaxID=45954 RepID=A0A9D4JCQ7_DREPO|nr:hypothetical protein DPMN_135306 [Dreissena polymorpha]
MTPPLSMQVQAHTRTTPRLRGPAPPPPIKMELCTLNYLLAARDIKMPKYPSLLVFVCY